MKLELTNVSASYSNRRNWWRIRPRVMVTLLLTYISLSWKQINPA